MKPKSDVFDIKQLNLSVAGLTEGEAENKEWGSKNRAVLERTLRKQSGQIVVGLPKKFLDRICTVLNADVSDLYVEEHPNYLAAEIKLRIRKKKRQPTSKV